MILKTVFSLDVVTYLPDTKALGTKGERVAAEYLAKKGYEILGMNVRFGRDEIDIVAKDMKEDMIVFIEVKTRSANAPNYPIRLAVDRRKRACLKRAAEKWCIAHDYDGPGRTDIVCVHEGRIVEHIRELGSELL